MTVPSTQRKAGPFNGNGSATSFAFTFKVFATSDIKVTTVDAAGVETVRVLATDYSVTLNANQETSPGGTVTYPISGSALPSGHRLTITGNLSYDQQLDLPSGGNFSPLAIENQLDRIVMQVQQLKEQADRAITAPVGTAVTTALPTPSPFDVLGWDSAGTALVNVDPSDFLTIAGSSGFSVSAFSGDGSTATFTLSANPGAIANLEVFISGVRQTPTLDYTVNGVSLVFVSPPPAGTNNILARWGQTLGIGVPSDTSVSTVKIADGAVTTAKIVDANVTAAKLANSGYELGTRNKIINGKMDIAQRGTNFAGLVGGPAYTLDRFAYYSVGGLVTISQQADAPSSNEFQNSLRVAVTTADTSIATTDVTVIEQKIEGYNVRDLIGRTFTLSFWVRSSKTGIHCVAFRNSGLNRSYIAEYSVSAANTWEYKIITVSGGLITAGTWNWTNGIGLYIDWSLAAGSSFQSTAGAWQTGSFLATANQVNCLDTIGNIFALTGVQLEAGPVATPFEHRPYGAELALCQRYYEKSYAIETPPGTATTTAAHNGFTLGQFWLYDQGTVQFQARKRAVPTVVTYAPGTGGSGLVRVNSLNVASTPVADQAKFQFTFSGTGSTSGWNVDWHWTADAEL